jgi:hypothetical protein
VLWYVDREAVPTNVRIHIVRPEIQTEEAKSMIAEEAEE